MTFRNTGIYFLFIIALLSMVFIWKKEEVAPLTYHQRIERLIKHYYQYFPSSSWITVSDFLSRQEQEEWLIVDARPPNERGVSMIPGAISRDTFEEKLHEFHDTHILVYCTIGYRSGKYVMSLRSRGFHVFNLLGGVLAWAGKGLPFITDEGQSTRRVHVYGKKWNAVPPAYEAVW